MKIYQLLIIKLLFAFIFALLIISCQEESTWQESSQIGYVEFSALVPPASEASNGRTDHTTADKLSHIVISIQNLHGDSLVNTQEIKLYNFNGAWVSEQISLMPGEYQITQFLVNDITDNILYATPKKGSEFAYLVDEPLSIPFTVKAEQVTKVTTEVISTTDKQPADFGYTAFSFQVVKTFDFLAGIFIYNDTIDDYQFTSAHLLISADGQILYDKELSAETHQITVKDYYENYQLVISKGGYDTYEQSFSNEELRAYTDSNKGPLVVTLHKTSEANNQIRLDSGLVAYYPFQGNAKDHSISGYHGNVTGATLTTDKNDSVSSAYSFDGQDDQINIGYVNLPIQDQVTMAAWVNTSSLSYVWIAGKYNWIEDKGYHLLINNGYAKFAGRDNNDEYIRSDSTPKMIADGQWHHVVGICNKNIWQVWVDGTLVAETDSQHTQVDINSNDPLTIGYYFQGGGKGQHQYFHGKIDNVRIYNRILNSEEIKKLHQDYL